MYYLPMYCYIVMYYLILYGKENVYCIVFLLLHFEKSIEHITVDSAFGMYKGPHPVWVVQVLTTTTTCAGITRDHSLCGLHKGPQFVSCRRPKQSVGVSFMYWYLIQVANHASIPHSFIIYNNNNVMDHDIVPNPRQLYRTVLSHRHLSVVEVHFMWSLELLLILLIKAAATS